ncbi:hypothetical protein JCM11641_008166 [Rhodosporidiobolus odoratus]
MPYFTLPVEQGELFYELLPPVPDPIRPTVLVLPLTWTDTSVVLQRFLTAVGEAEAERYNVLTVDLRSLSILGFAPIYEQPDNLRSYTEIQQSWLQTEDPELFYETVEELLWYCAGSWLETEEKDWLAGMLTRRYTPSQALRVFETTLPIVSPTRINRSTVAQIRCPVLIIAGGVDSSCPAGLATEFVGDLKKSQDAKLYVIENAPNFLSFTHSSMTIPLLLSFLDQNAFLEPTQPFAPYSFPDALFRLASLFPAYPVRPKDPLDSRSYSLVTAKDEVRNLLWERACELHGAAFVTPAAEGAETWEEGGRLGEEKEGWKFSRRNDHVTRPAPWVWSLPPQDAPTTTTTVASASPPSTPRTKHEDEDLDLLYSPMLQKAGKSRVRHVSCGGKTG